MSALKIPVLPTPIARTDAPSPVRSRLLPDTLMPTPINTANDARNYRPGLNPEFDLWYAQQLRAESMAEMQARFQREAPGMVNAQVRRDLGLPAVPVTVRASWWERVKAFFL